MKKERGNIWLIELTKNPSDIVGHEEGKTRPCLIIVNNKKVRMTTIIPLTGNLSAKRFPHTYTLKKSSKNQYLGQFLPQGLYHKLIFQQLHLAR